MDNKEKDLCDYRIASAYGKTVFKSSPVIRIPGDDF